MVRVTPAQRILGGMPGVSSRRRCHLRGVHEWRVGAGKRLLRPVGTVAVTLPRLRRKDGDGLQQPHRRHPDDVDLTGVSAGGEQQVFVASAGGTNVLNARAASRD